MSDGVVECGKCPLQIKKPAPGYWGSGTCQAGLYGEVCPLGLTREPKPLREIYYRLVGKSK